MYLVSIRKVGLTSQYTIYLLTVPKFDDLKVHLTIHRELVFNYLTIKLTLHKSINTDTYRQTDTHVDTRKISFHDSPDFSPYVMKKN